MGCIAMSAPNGYPPQGWPTKPQAAPAADPYARPQSSAQPQWPQQHPQAVVHATQGQAQPGQWGQQAPVYGQPQAYPPSAAQSLASAISQGRAAGQGYAQPAGYPPAQQQSGIGPAPEPYAPQFSPYTPQTQPSQRPAGQPQQAATGFGARQPQHQYDPSPAQPQQGFGDAAAAARWPSAAPRDYDIGAYMPQQQPAPAFRQQPAAEPAFSDWSKPATSYADDPYQQPQQAGDDLGFAQAAGGELDPAYDEEQDYEYEDAPRRRRPVMIAAAVVGAVLVGGGLAYGYKMILGDGVGGQPPVIKSAMEPSKTKPAEAGGKQFAHSDSKIMGRLGEGSVGAAAATVGESSSASAEVDASGTRKVSTLVVGRDGSIQPPAVAPAAQPPSGTEVPGLTLVDALGQHGANQRAAPASSSAPATPQVVNATASEQQKVAVSPPPVAKAEPPASTGSVNDSAAADEAPVAKPPASKPKKVAALAPAAATLEPKAASATASPSGANGYVAVLASVPASSSSRMDALKRFADMQQKYGPLLTGKTPDVAEANLGAKGNYHRLVVGPPASREQASTLCTQLKSQGYNDCWVAPY